MAVDILRMLSVTAMQLGRFISLKLEHTATTSLTLSIVSSVVSTDDVCSLKFVYVLFNRRNYCEQRDKAVG